MQLAKEVEAAAIALGWKLECMDRFEVEGDAESVIRAI